MNRTRILTVVSLAAATLGLSAAAAIAYSPSGSQDRAARACHEQGIAPDSVAWELCVSHVTRAYEWDEIGLAQQMARAAGRADNSCRQFGTRPETRNYRACVSREIDAHSQLLILGDDQTGVNVAQQQ